MKEEIGSFCCQVLGEDAVCYRREESQIQSGAGKLALWLKQEGRFSESVFTLGLFILQLSLVCVTGKQMDESVPSKWEALPDGIEHKGLLLFSVLGAEFSFHLFLMTKTKTTFHVSFPCASFSPSLLQLKAQV